MKSFRVAMVGVGNIAKIHAKALAQFPECAQIVAAVDIDPDNLNTFCTENHISNAYSDMESMLAAQKPDLVVICTPPATHFELCAQALQNGAHVFCEKPWVASLDEVDRLQALEAQTGLTCSTVFQWRFGSAVQHFKSLIDRRELGRPLLGLCNTTWYRDDTYYAMPWRGKWETELGGTTMGHGIHAMDMFLWLMGDWVEVNAIIATLDRNIEVEDTSLAHVRFKNGALGSIVNSVVSPRQVSYVRFDFQQATVELEHLYSHSNQHWRFNVPDGAIHQAKLEQWRHIPEDIHANHAAQYAHVLGALERGEKPLTTGTQSRNTVEFLTALYKSALTHQPIQRGSIQVGDPFYYHVYGAQKPTRDLRLGSIRQATHFSTLPT